MSKASPWNEPLTPAEKRKIETFRKSIGRGGPFTVAWEGIAEGSDVIRLATAGATNSIDRVEVYLLRNPKWYWIEGGGLITVAYRKPYPPEFGGWDWRFASTNVGDDVEPIIEKAGLSKKIAQAARKYGFRWPPYEEDEENPMRVYSGIIGYWDEDGEYHHLGALDPVGARMHVLIEEAEPGPYGAISLSFGVMPSWKEFAEAFAEHCPDGFYNITTGVGGESGLQRAMEAAGVSGDMLGYRDSKTFTARELYDVLMHLKEDWEDKEGGAGLASSIMDTLGYEWV